MKGSDNTENNKSPSIPTVEFRIPIHNVRVPKEIILQNTYPEHRISALFYLNYNQTWDGMVNYSPIYMIQWSGYQPNWNRHKNRESIYDKFLNQCSVYF